MAGGQQQQSISGGAEMHREGWPSVKVLRTLVSLRLERVMGVVTFPDSHIFIYPGLFHVP